MNVIMIVVMMLLNDAGGVEKGEAYALRKFSNLAACEEEVKSYNNAARRVKADSLEMKNVYTVAYCEGDV